MSEEDPQVAHFFDLYDEVALAVLDDQRPNTHSGMEMSNADMVEEICRLMEWEDFDIFTPFDFGKVYKDGAVHQILAHFYLAHLRLEIFYSAKQEEIGDRLFNKTAISFSEYWYLKLRDRYDALYSGQETSHSWMH